MVSLLRYGASRGGGGCSVGSLIDFTIGTIINGLVLLWAYRSGQRNERKRYRSVGVVYESRTARGKILYTRDDRCR